MVSEPLFSGLVYDEDNQPVETTLVGQESFYVVDDDGFLRHVPSEQVDRQVLKEIWKHIEGHEEIISEQAMKMLGQEDIFSRAVMIDQLKNIEGQFEQIIRDGLPEEGRTYMGMTGFKVIINHHGDVIEVNQPGRIIEEE